MSTNFTYYLHGHPKGFDFLGQEDEKRSFQERFFQGVFSSEQANGQKGLKELRVEVLKINHTQYYYYTCFLGENILGIDNRPGYFAITIRMERYYKRATTLFFIIDAFIHSFLEDILFTNYGNCLKFKVQDLQSVKGQLIQFNNKLEEIIFQLTNNADLINLSNISSSHQNRRYVNIIDATDDLVSRLIQQSVEVSISASHQTISLQNEIDSKEQEIKRLQTNYDNQLEAEKKKFGQELESKSKKISELTITQKDGHENAKKLQQKLNILDNELSDLKNIIRKFNEDTSRFRTLPTSKGQNPQPPKPDPTPQPPQSKKDLEIGQHRQQFLRHISVLSLIIGFVVFGFILWSLKHCDNKEDSASTSSATSITSTTSAYTDEELIENREWSIDVKDFNATTNPLQKGEQYIVSIKVNKHGSDNNLIQNGKFVCQDSMLTIKKVNENYVELIPNDTGSCVLRFVSDGKYCEREFKIK